MDDRANIPTRLPRKSQDIGCRRSSGTNSREFLGNGEKPPTAEYKPLPTADPGENPLGPYAQGYQDGEPIEDEPLEMTEAQHVIGDIFIHGVPFQTFMAFIIMFNALIIGLETDMTEYSWLWDIIENALLLIFTFELGLRVFYWRSSFLTCLDARGNAFDATLVGIGLVDFFVATVLQGNIGSLGFYIKACRLLRILRLFRLFKMIKPLYMLASGFLDSTTAVFWVTVLCSLGLYICAIFLTRTLGRVHDADNHLVYADKFGSVLHSMFTLFKLMSDPDLDSVQDIMLSSPAMMIFFTAFIIYGSFAMLSILTGVISEGMIEKGNSHKEEMRFIEEQKKIEFMKKLRQHFAVSDTDGDGTMTREEFEASIPQMMYMFQEEGFFYKEGDLCMVFDLVDVDKGGTVEVEEFLQGMTSFTANVSDLPLQLLKLQSHVFVHLNKMQDTMMTALDRLEQGQKNLNDKINVLALKSGVPSSALGSGSQ